MDTLATMRGSILRFNKDDEEAALVNDAINDGIESLWRSAILVSLEQFLVGPIKNLVIQAGSERETIISVADPPLLTGAQVSAAAQTGLAARTEYFHLTYVTPSGSETNVDGASDNPPAAGGIFSLALLADQGSQVQAPTFPLVPPPATFGTPIGFNIYAGVDPNNLCKQNSIPLLFNQVWKEPATGLLVNDTNQQLLPPAVNGTADNIAYIALLEVQNPDSTWTRWDQSSLDSLLMERCVRTVAPTTSFQRYAYDLVNGTTLEIRPALGTTLNPRYFYVAKPYRLAFDNAQIPFTTLSYSEFIRMYAQAQINRSNHEFTAASANSSQGERVRQEVLQVLNKNPRQKSVTPYFRW